MPPKSQDSTILNAIRLARTQPVTFGKGLIRTDDNSILGYVSDLNNMEVDRNGNVRRRKGTVAMNSGKLNDKWYFLESYQIAGVPILFGLSYKRELWAWIDTWPEVDIKVCDKNTYGRFPHYSANSTDPVFNTWVSFSRGSSFHVLKTDRHITIVNNLNDAIRIYSKGCFALAAYKEDVTQVFAKEDIEAVRDNEELELAMYLSIKDVTNKIIEPAITIKTDDTGPLIEGTIQFASINEEGTAGRFTDLQKIETSSPVFSIFDGVYVGDSKKYTTPITRKLYSDDGQQNLYGLIEDNGAGTVSNSKWTPSNSLSSSTYERTYVPIILVRQDLYNDGEIFATRNYMVFLKKSGANVPFIKTTDIYFELKDMRSLYPKTDDFAEWPRNRFIGDVTVKLSTLALKDIAINFNEITGVSYAANDEYQVNFSSAISEANWYNIEGFNVDARTASNTTFMFSPGSKGYSNMCFFVAGLEVYKKIGSNEEYELNALGLEYKGFLFEKANNGIVGGFFNVNNIIKARHLGFNTWDLEKIETEITATPDDGYVSMSYTFLDSSGIPDYDFVLVDNRTYEDGLGNGRAKDFLSSGFKWCVKSGDSIKAISQTGILNLNADNIRYSFSPLSGGLPVNVNQMESEYKKCYMPLISLNGSTLFSYIDQDKNREVFYDVQYAFNVDNQLFVIQDGAIWVGDTNTLKLTYDKAIQGAVLCADKFYGGLLIGTTDGLYFYNQGQLTNVIDGQAIIAKGIRSGVNGALVIDEYGRPQYITVQINEGGIYGRLLDISQPVSDIVFDGINMIFVDGVFYVAQDDKVFGLTVYREEGGLLAVWGRVYVWEGQKISLIANHNNRLVVAFETGAVKSEVFEQPYDSGIS